MTQRRQSQTTSETLAPTGALLGCHTAVSAAIDQLAVGQTNWDPTTLDLLTRLRLSPNDQLRASDLCEQLLLSPSHVSRRLDKAESDGLIRRTVDSSDRRARTLTLTAKGRKVSEQFLPKLESVLETIIFETLSAKEISSLIETLESIEASARHLISTSNGE